jgi:ABC-type multidrug transport system fused ATPase/permease subunit
MYTNIDSESEQVIQRATEKILEGRTSIVVAHRLSTVASSDLVVVLEQGQVIEVGPPSELLAQKGHYFQFLNTDSMQT